MIRNYNLLSGSRDTRLKNKNVTDVDISPTAITSKKGLPSLYLGWLMAFVLVFCGLGAHAQSAAGYTLSESTEVYTQVVGTNSTATGDDGIQGPTNIGFDFVFEGITYTQFSVNTNGVVKLGGTTIGGSAWVNSLANSATHRPVITAFWDDNHRNTGSIQYALSGTAPNRTLEIGWHNINIGGSGSTSATNLASYKVRLYETSNLIDFVYGPTMASAGTLTASIGLNGLSTFLSITPGATATASSTTANNSIASTADLVGKKFTLTPPLPPATPPNCATALVPADLATGVSTIPTLSWAAATGAPVSYDVYFGTSATPPLATNTLGLSYSPAALAINTTYYWKVVPKNAAGDAVGCSTQSFTTASSYTYCTPTYSSGGCLGDEITSVTLSTLSDTGLTCTPTYADRSGVQNAIPTISQSATSVVSVSFGTHTTQHSGVWIDYNQNGTFEASEFSIGASVGANGTANISVAVPGTALLGLTKMRVRGGDDSAMSATQACGATNSSFGTSRDYTVNIGPPPTCIAPTALTATALTTTGATLNWTCATCTGTYRLEYNTSPATFGGVGNVVIDPATSGTVISGLTQNTNYTFFVRQDCGGTNGVSTVSAGSFLTPSAGETCADAPLITVAPDLASSTLTSVLTGNTADGPAGTCSGVTGNPNKRDRWISFVAPTNGNKIIINTTGGTLTDWVMQVWEGCPATGTALGCSDDVNVLMPQIELCQNQYVGGQTYYIQLWPYSDLAGSCNVRVYEAAACPIPPDNDDCTGVETISVGLAGSCPDNATFGTTVNATASPGIVKATCDPFGTYLDVIYKFNSGTNTDLNLNFTNITGTNEFGIYSGCGLTYLGVCSSASYSNIITGLTPNTDYYIVVWANSVAAQGTFSICLNSLAPPACVTAPLSPTNGATNVNTCAATTLSWTGVAEAVAYDVYFNAGTSATTLASADQAAFIGTNTYNAGLLLPSTTYAWRVVGKNSAGAAVGCTDFTFTTGAGIATPGNTFATANDLGLLGTTLSASGDTTCYTNDYTTTSTPGNTLARASNDVFYKFTLGCNTTVTLGTCTNNFDTYMHLLDSTGAWIDSDDDTCPANAGSLIENIALTAGTYYVVVEGFSGSGTFTLDIANTGGACSSVVNLKMFIEGYYIGGGAMTTVADNQAGNPPTSTDVETITVELHDATAPYALAATTTAMLKTDGTVTANFNTAPSGSYYIAVLTRNAIQTWSATPQTVGSTPITYNFSDAITKAYADNMIEIEAGIFAFFSGDITDGLSQDGLIDGADYSKWEADNNDFAFGVFATDLNGDGLVDGADYSIWESNNNNFIFANIPQ